ncbi:Uncharacterised protein [Sphingobacterium daejeonense]|nr:Uncharacterised protein [Sphingobacterium daejeonense]
MNLIFVRKILITIALICFIGSFYFMLFDRNEANERYGYILMVSLIIFTLLLNKVNNLLNEIK